MLVPIEQKPRDQVYGSFRRGGIEYAIESSAIVQVIDMPNSLTSVQGDGQVLGYCKFRSELCAVVDIPQSGRSELSPMQKLLVCETESRYVGIVIDSVEQVFRQDFATLMSLGNSLPDLKLIKGLFTFRDSERLVQCIDASALVNAFQIRTPPVRNQITIKAKTQNGPLKRFVCVSIGQFSAAIPTESILEVVIGNDLKTDLRQSEDCAGHIERSGDLVFVANLDHLLKLPPFKFTKEKPGAVVVIEYKARVVGLRVESLDDFVVCRESDILPCEATVPQQLHARISSDQIRQVPSGLFYSQAHGSPRVR